MDIDRGRVAKEALYRREVEIALPSSARRTAEDHLRDVIFAHQLREAVSDASPAAANDPRPQIFGEADIFREGLLVLGASVATNIDIEDEELAIHCLRHARSASDDVLCRGIGADAN